MHHNKELRLSVAITTAPRPEPTITRCFESICQDAPVDIYEDEKNALGPAGNFVLAVKSEIDLLWWNWLLVLQDDAIVCQNLVQYLSDTDLPDGWLSPYCHTPQHRDDVVGWHFPKQIPGGAVAYLLRRELAEQFMAAPFNAKTMKNGLDWSVGRWCAERRIPMWLHSPSLVQHIGTTRAIGYRYEQTHPEPMEWVEKRYAGHFCPDARTIMARRDGDCEPPTTCCEARLGE